MHCIGPIGDTYLSRYSLKEFGIQEGQVAQVEMHWLNPEDYTSVGVECGGF